MSITNRVEINSGADASIVVRVKDPLTRDPFDLTNATNIQFTFDTRDRGKLTVDNVEVPAQVANLTYDNIALSAVNAGADGNLISLVFDGIADLDTIVNAWNTANPTNQAQHGGVGNEVLVAGTARLTDGYNAYTPVEIIGEAILGRVRITLLEKETSSLKRGPNQSFKMTIDQGAFPGGVRTKGSYDRLDVIDE
jgi:hypothetical protein